MRELLTAARTYYVRTDGNDSNDGLTDSPTGAFLTIQHAWDIVSGTIDMGGFLVTIQIGDGSYNGGVSDGGKPLVGGRVWLRGNPTNPGNVIISETGDDCIQMSDSVISASGFTLHNSGGSAIHVYRSGIVNFENINFGDCIEAHVFVDNEGQAIGTSAGYSIVGDAPIHWSAHTGGLITIGGRPITLVSSRTFSTCFAYALRGGIIEAVNNTYTGSATGRRFIVDNNGTIYTGSTSLTTFPGNQAGQLINGSYGNNLSPFAAVETGSWTPTYLGRTTAGTTSYVARSGSYTKVGPLVFVQGVVIWNSATGTGQAAIGGLPFTPNVDAPISLSYSNVTFGSGKQGILYIIGAESRIGLYASDPAGGPNASVAVELDGDLRFSGVYSTSDTVPLIA